MKLWLGMILAVALAACTTVEEGKRKPDPNASARDRVALATEYLKKGDSESAQQQLQKALKSNPDSAEAHLMMGVVLDRDGDVKGADREYRKAIRLKADYSQAHNNYAVFLFRSGRYKEALPHFQAASDDLSYELRAQAFEGMGRCHLKLGDKAAAEQSFLRALRLDNSLPIATLEVADIYFSRGETDTARKGYQRFLQQTGDRPQTAQSLWLGIRLERAAGAKGDRNALASYELALKRLYPNSPEYKLYAASLPKGQ